MAEEKISLQWKNPCRYCLVKPACIRKCILLQNHIELFGTVASLLVVVGSFLILAGFAIFSYFHWGKQGTLIGLAIYLVVMYGLMLYHHLKDPRELKEMKTIERCFIILLFPWLMISVGCWIPVENKIASSGHMFRFHKSINPYIDPKKDF